MTAPMLTSCFLPGASPVTAVSSPSYQSVPSSTKASFSLASTPPGAFMVRTLARFFLFPSSG